jgi:hypothetical protein
VESKIDNLNVKLDYIIPFTLDIFEEIIKKKQISPLREFPSLNMISNINDSTGNIANNTFGTLKSMYKAGNYVNQIENTPKSLNLNKENANNINLNGNELNPNDMTLIRGSNITEINSFTTNQLYQFAASNDFEVLIQVLEKLDQGRLLDDIDRKLLSDYSFILKDKPKTALSKLTNAKNRVDKMRNLVKLDEKPEKTE